MNPNVIPTFTILSIGNQGAVGAWSDPKWIGDGHIACLLTDTSHVSWGRLRSVDWRRRQCTFAPDDAGELANFRIGRSYALLDGYWGERAELVLDDSLVWRDREYVSRDAVWFERSRTMCAFSGEIPEGGTLVKGGWDHEHCEVCWETISPQIDSAAVFAEPDHWICNACYRRFVIPRSLDFIVDPAAEPWWKFWRKWR